ncbi:D-glycero-beta-D-manno-heptose 1-phosphate adenylyltransferase [Niabella ginsengisoli]|uniref:D-glycero-beta-D-manno-heptose 1-phosphate adenylyltransferase n=1 Tax=Niabella ginsengisoli TaxID=522298 RepID=A0ABS9SH62_9BACT|nr:D-glycero-beta-D-manno-heptose 1-phosphate adenylyltransferase [Niabella ginsengisoli]MCH5597704.1 D-glycero-beta-D-manno-heptose 1-phosphate adenylyltransferase [Niabella ginsengisoli]
MSNSVQNIRSKIMLLKDVAILRAQWKTQGQKVVFTNGVFDILHAGHVQSLMQAHDNGDRLIIGLNADVSVKRLKGESRPIINERDRALLLAALQFVDAVVLFEEDTPIVLIEKLLPDVLIKSADYNIENIVGAKEVIANGGEVKIMPFVKGLSSTNIIEKIKSS